MTPFQLYSETTTRPRRAWPPYAWAIVAGAAIAMFVSVVLVAWQASNMPRHEVMGDAPPAAGTSETAQQVRDRLEGTCRRVEHWRATQTGIYDPAFQGVQR
jgi:hypothetical protein